MTLEEQVARIRERRARRFNSTKVRTALNAVFLALAAIGLAMYFLGGNNHVPALCVIAAGMLFKVAEFIIRIL